MFIISVALVLAYVPLTAAATTPVQVSTAAELRSAIQNATGPTVIEITGDITVDSTFPFMHGSSMNGATFLIDSDQDITLKGNSQNPAELRFDHMASMFRTLGKLTLEDGLVFVGGGMSGRPAILQAGGTVIMNGGEFNGSSSGEFVSVESGTLTINGGEINAATTPVNVPGGTLIMNDGTIGSRGGVAVSNGGVFTMNGGEIYFVDGFFGSASGVFLNGFSAPTTFTMNGGNIHGNTAYGISGSSNVTVIINDGHIYNNTAGGIRITGNCSLEVNGGEIRDNGGDMSGDGGVVVANNSTMIMTSGAIHNNISTSSWSGGGGVHVSGGCSFTMSGGEIRDNHAINDGGGVFVMGQLPVLGSPTIFTMTGGEIFNNTADGQSGGVHLSASPHAVLEFNRTGGRIFDNTPPNEHDEAATAPTIITTSLSGGMVGTAYSATLAAIGGRPITWTIDSGNLPTGLSLSGNSITGTPTAAGTFHFTVKAENAIGSVTQALSIVVLTDPTPTITQHPRGAVVESGHSIGITLSVTTAARDDGTLSYQWFGNTTNSNTGGTPIGGATGREFLPPMDAGAIGTTFYYVVVTNTSAGGTASAVSNTARVRIHDPALTFHGDANGDGIIDAGDLTHLRRAFLGMDGHTSRESMDVNGDGRINAADITFLRRALLGIPGYEL